MGLMVKQASDAVIAAYRDGRTRQTVRLNLDPVCPPQRWAEAGMEALRTAALPVAKKFTEGLALPSGAALKDVRISDIDREGMSSGDVASMLYRVSEDPAQDVAVVLLGGRNFAVQESTQSFLDGMGDRLVVLMNQEDASSKFDLGSQGQEFTWGGGAGADIGTLKDFCELFKDETYYYRLRGINDWVTVIFRAYPHPWEVYIEGLQGQIVKLGESPTKPYSDTIMAWMVEYEEANGITTADKTAKMLKTAVP